MIDSAREAFVKLPNEQILFKSSPRTSFELSNNNMGNHYPASQPFTLKSDGGVVYVTNQRVRPLTLRSITNNIS